MQNKKIQNLSCSMEITLIILDPLLLLIPFVPSLFILQDLLKPWALMVACHFNNIHVNNIYVMAMEEKDCQENYLHHAN